MLGVIAVYVSVRPVAKDRPLAPLISTIGLTIILQNLAVYILGGQQVAFPETIKQELYHFGPVTISSVQIFILGVAITLMVRAVALHRAHQDGPRHPRHRREP